MSKEQPPKGYVENPEWTALDFVRAKPAGEVLPPEVLAAFAKPKGGRPRGSTKEQVSLRIDRDVLERFRATGPGWQSRMNTALRKAIAAEPPEKAKRSA